MPPGASTISCAICAAYSRMMEKQAPDHPAEMNLMLAAFEKMRVALRSTGRPIFYSFCEYGLDAVWGWAPSVGQHVAHHRRHCQDSYAHLTILSQQAGLAPMPAPDTGTTPICWKSATEP